MPNYKATVEIIVNGNDVDWLYDAIDQLRVVDGVKVTRVSPCADNPVDYPFDDEDEEDWDEDEEDWDEDDDDYWGEDEDDW